MATYTPKLMYALSAGLLGAVQMETATVGGSGQGAPVFSYGGKLYQVMQQTGAQHIYVMQSADRGQTWNILDEANSPSRAPDTEPTAGVFYDGLNTLTVAYITANIGVGGSIVLQAFDLVAGTWGATFGAGSPSVNVVNQVFKRSDSSYVVITNRALSGITALGITAHILTAGVWSAVNLDTNVTGGRTNNGTSSACIQSNDRIHVFGFTLDAGVRFAFYQALEADNSLGSSTNFNAGTFNYRAGNMQSPIIVSGNLVWGVRDSATGTVPTILVGAPLSAPAFSVLGGSGIDSGNPGFNQVTICPTLATDGATIFGVYAYDDGVNSQVRIASTTNVADPITGPWTGSSFYNDAASQILLETQQYPTISVISGNPNVTIQGPPPGSSGPFQPTNFFFFLVAARPPKITLRGVKRRRIVPCPPKYADHCPPPNRDRAI